VDDDVTDDYGVGGDCGDFLNRLTKLFQLHEYHVN